MTGDGAGIFEAERPALMSLAYRMLGEHAAAEDVVQEAWIKWQTGGKDTVRMPAAWLRRVTAHLAIDALRKARRRRETYMGPWLPEPLLAGLTSGPEDALDLARECELALLWAMERLSPEERAAFILRSAFDASYDELAKMLGKSQSACRQLVSRASKRMKDAAPRFHIPAEEKEALLSQFAQAVTSGDRVMILALLAPDAIAVTDGGGKVRAALRPLSGAQEIAQVMISLSKKLQGVTATQIIFANGDPALALFEGGQLSTIYAIGCRTASLINWIYIMRNPDKLPRIAPPAGIA